MRNPQLDPLYEKIKEEFKDWQLVFTRSFAHRPKPGAEAFQVIQEVYFHPNGEYAFMQYYCGSANKLKVILNEDESTFKDRFEWIHEAIKSKLAPTRDAVLLRP